MTHRAHAPAPAAVLAIAAALAALLSGCAGKPKAVAIASPPAAIPPAPPPPMPAGAHPGMAIPALLADGRYDTPNRDLSAAATLWHLRSALNVAALACRGTGQADVVAAYNGWLVREKAPLAAAQAAYAAEYRATGAPAWRSRYDDDQTRLYNFFAQAFARDGFCRAAASTLEDAAWVDDAALPGFAAGRLAVLELPFTDFYRAYDAWRARADPAPPAMVIASVAPVPPVADRRPLELDPAVFADDTVTH